MKRLHLILKKNYFDDILSGNKKAEYRLATPYWYKRLNNRTYSHVEFQNGYSKKAQRISVEIVKIELTTIKHDFFGGDEVLVFKINLGNLL